MRSSASRRPTIGPHPKTSLHAERRLFGLSYFQAVFETLAAQPKGPAILLLSISFDPARDTLTELAEYAIGEVTRWVHSGSASTGSTNTPMLRVARLLEEGARLAELS